MILPAQTIRALSYMIYPFYETDTDSASGLSFGLGPAGYDIRLGSAMTLYTDEVKLGVSLEHFHIPTDILGIVHDKSTWARQGVFVQNTVIEPGWKGYLTLEISRGVVDKYYTLIKEPKLVLRTGTPIAQIVFHRLEAATECPYSGIYQNQGPEPQHAKFKDSR